MYRAQTLIHICEPAIWHCIWQFVYQDFCLYVQSKLILAGKPGRALCISVHAKLKLCAEADCSYQGMPRDRGRGVKQRVPCVAAHKAGQAFMLVGFLLSPGRVARLGLCVVGPVSA